MRVTFPHGCGMRRVALRVICVVAAVCGYSFASSDQVLAQAGAGLPPPTASRAPALTRMSADSIRLQITYLKLSQLLQNLQQTAGAALDVDAAEITWSAADERVRTDPRCTSLGAVASQLRSRVGGLQGSGVPPSVPVFFNHVQVTDFPASDTAVVAVRVIIRLPGDSSSAVAALTYKHSQARWYRASGLLTALCAAATRP